MPGLPIVKFFRNLRTWRDVAVRKTRTTVSVALWVEVTLIKIQYGAEVGELRSKNGDCNSSFCH